jgi:hypothetical protein
MPSTRIPITSVLGLCLTLWQTGQSQELKPGAVNRNRVERVEWFRDAGFGLFIHWNFDSQLGPTISHSMVGASEDYLRRFMTELPKTFHPKKFDPREWAVLAKLAGMKYVVFTTKHHSGFCMFPTVTTPFNIMNTPFRRDKGLEITAMRAQRLYDDRKWPNPVVLKMTHVKPAMEPPRLSPKMPHGIEPQGLPSFGEICRIWEKQNR